MSGRPNAEGRGGVVQKKALPADPIEPRPPGDVSQRTAAGQWAILADRGSAQSEWTAVMAPMTARWEIPMGKLPRS